MRYSLLPLQYRFQGFSSYQGLFYLDKEVLRNRQQTIPPPLATIFMEKIDKIAMEFYAQYGYAMHTIQTIEKGLLILYALWEYRENNISKIDYLKILTKPLALGTLKDKLLTLGVFDESSRDKLTKVNHIRRFLAHNFWWERSLEFDNEKQLRSLNLEILSYLESFYRLINIIDTLINLWRKEKNIYIEKELGLETVYEIKIYLKNHNK